METFPISTVLKVVLYSDQLIINGRSDTFLISGIGFEAEHQPKLESLHPGLIAKGVKLGQPARPTQASVLPLIGKYPTYSIQSRVL